MLTVHLPSGYNLKEAEHLLCKDALEKSDYVLIRAAELLGITRHAVKRRMKKFGIEVPQTSKISESRGAMTLRE